MTWAATGQLFERMAEVCCRLDMWFWLSPVSRRALSTAYAGPTPHLHPATRRCLRRYNLINERDAITLRSRAVVREADKSGLNPDGPVRRSRLAEETRTYFLGRTG